MLVFYIKHSHLQFSLILIQLALYRIQTLLLVSETGSILNYHFEELVAILNLTGKFILYTFKDKQLVKGKKQRSLYYNQSVPLFEVSNTCSCIYSLKNTVYQQNTYKCISYRLTVQLVVLTQQYLPEPKGFRNNKTQTKVYNLRPVLCLYHKHALISYIFIAFQECFITDLQMSCVVFVIQTLGICQEKQK